jgi:hypothetical protein
MAIAMFSIFSIVIAIAICRVALVVAPVDVRATPFCSVIIAITVAALNSGSATVLETGGRAIAAAETPGATIATAFNAAGRTIAAPETWAATVASASQRGATAASATAIASASKRGSAAAATRATATTGASTTAVTSAPATSAASTASTAFAGKINKVGAGVC